MFSLMMMITMMRRSGDGGGNFCAYDDGVVACASLSLSISLTPNIINYE